MAAGSDNTFRFARAAGESIEAFIVVEDD